MVSEFMTLNKQEKAQVIFEMVNELMKETCLPKIICCKIIAEYKGYSVKQIKNYIKMVDTDFYYFAVMYTRDGYLLTTQDIDSSCKHILKNIVKQNELDDMESFKRILKDYFENMEW